MKKQNLGKRYSRIEYDEPIEEHENEQNEEQNNENGGRPYRRGYNGRRFFRRYRRYNRNYRRPFSIEVVLTEDATTLQLPERKTTGSAGADLKALIGGTIPAHGMLTGVRTGIKIKIPNKGTVGWITPRSGMSSEGITIINAPGEIDSDYRGEIGLPIHNDSDEIQLIRAHERVAQLILHQACEIDFIEQDNLSETDRGTGGFGSTGRM